MRLIHFYRFSLEKCGKIWKNRLFFRAALAGLGKYCIGRYGRIGVYRDNVFPIDGIAVIRPRGFPIFGHQAWA